MRWIWITVWNIGEWSALTIMFHPVSVSLRFSIIYLTFHIIPSSSSLGALRYYNDASCYDLHLTASSKFAFINTPRLVPNSSSSSIVGGDTAAFLPKRESCKLLSTPTTFKFLFYTVTIKLSHSNLALYNIYRPPQSTTKYRQSVAFSVSIGNFQTLISSVSTSPHEFLNTGDFNIHVDILTARL